MSAVIVATPEAPAIAPVSPRRPIIMVAIAVVLGALFTWLAPANEVTTFIFNLGEQFFEIPDWVVNSRVAAGAFAVVAIIAAVAAWPLHMRRRSVLWPSFIMGAALVMSFLAWVAADERLPVTGLLQGSLLLAVPLVFGAMGGVLCERAGVININIEGQLLAGAFMGAVIGSLTVNVYLGLVAAPLAGALIGVLLAIFATRYFVDQVVVGVVLNVLVIGLTGFLYSRFLTEDADRWNNPPRLPNITIPVLSEIPVVGPVMFEQNLIVYLMYITVILVQVGLFSTRWGLRVRAVGEHPEAADSVGIRVNSVRFRTVVLGAAVAGLGGAFFTLGSVGAFGREMTAGNGFIALAAVIFGRWTPLGSLGAALLFGFAYNLQNVLSIIGSPIPSQFLLMAPYLVTLVAVVGLVGKVRAPAADGIPFRKSSWVDSMDIDWTALRASAIDVMGRAYAPYSRFKVGVAGLVDDGRVVTGCNVENAAYGVGLCAECGMVSELHASGGGRLVAVACVDQHGDPLMPCGRCRQLLWEHGGADCLLATPEGVLPMRDVLPQAFGPEDLVARREDRS